MLCPKTQKLTMSLCEKIDNDKLLILDGAIGTELHNRGYKLDENLWSALMPLKNEKAVYELHADYIKAGADIITTCSYQIEKNRFIENGYSENQYKTSLKNSIRIAKKAVQKETNKKVFVACSISCIGASIQKGGIAHEFDGKYIDKMTEKEVIDFHKDRLIIALEENPDIILLETYPCFREIEIILKKIFKNLQTKTEVVVSFSVKDEFYTCYGDKIEDCFQKLENLKIVSAFGVNCLNPEISKKIMKRIRKKFHTPIIMYPNSGEEYSEEEKFQWKKQTEEMDWKEYIKRIFSLNCSIVGGCCRTNPKIIKIMSSFKNNEL